MSLRGRINQGVEDWRNQASAAMKTHTDHGPQIESILQHAIDKNRPPAPSTRDGVDLLVIIVFIWFVCLIAGYVIGRNT